MRILIVEDEAKTAGYLKQGLSESGYAVDIAVNGIDGLHKALEDDFDLVILDVMLPVLDGWGVLDGLRRRKQTPVHTANTPRQSRRPGPARASRAPLPFAASAAQ
ncbi:response regulator [Jeongeupia wiesaeckerbachi]|uniref:response regulator n=1 Tax=Jeongeupia wiesaeckerbachi TaxID=3051218 RepID=UPI003D8096A6